MVEVLKALTPRLADSQSNLKPLAASALAEVASSVGADSSPKVQGPSVPVRGTFLMLLLCIHAISLKLDMDRDLYFPGLIERISWCH